MTRSSTVRVRFSRLNTFSVLIAVAIVAGVFPFFLADEDLHVRLTYFALLLYFVSLGALSATFLARSESRTTFLIVVAVVSLIDALIFLVVAVPSFFGYRGASESYAWTTLGIAVVTGAAGLFVLGPAFLVSWLVMTRRRRKSASMGNQATL